jgi:hypothetical protein
MNKLVYCDIPVIYKKVSTKHHHEMRKWLVDNIAPECYDAEDFHAVNGDYTLRRIWFSNDSDAVLFALRWT